MSRRSSTPHALRRSTRSFVERPSARVKRLWWFWLRQIATPTASPIQTVWTYFGLTTGIWR
jgi:hypothetical protein